MKEILNRESVSDPLKQTCFVFSCDLVLAICM